MENRYADWYNACFSSMAYDANYIQIFCDRCDEGVILEPGSGTGRLVPYLKCKERKFLEPSPEMIEVFLNNHPDEKQNLIQGSANKIPLPDESVAGIYVPFGGIIELFPIIFSLKEFYRILKKYGKLLICAPNPDFPKIRETIGINKDSNEIEKHFQYFIRTFKTPIGKYSCQTMLTIRENFKYKNEHSFFINNQYMLPKEKLEELCNKIGFTVDCIHGDYDGSKWFKESRWILMNLTKANINSNIKGDEHLTKLIDVYDTIADKYDSFAEKGDYVMPKWLNAKLRNINFMKPNILDLGCANGYLGKIAKNIFNPCSITGVDISPKMIFELNKSNEYDNSIVWDLHDGLPFIEAELFDLIFAFGVLEFIGNPEIVLEQISECLKINGYLLASFECFDERKHNLKHFIHPKIGFPKYLYTMEDIQNLLTRAKLEIVSSEKIMAYKSPSTGEDVDYFVLLIKRDGRI